VAVERAPGGHPLKPAALIAAGRTAEIYQIDLHRVLKLMRPGFAGRDLLVERRHMRLAARRGLPVPCAGPVLRRSGRLGLVIEAVQGPTLAAHVRQHPGVLSWAARSMATLQRKIHASTGQRLPSLKQRLMQHLVDGVDLPASTRQWLLSTLSGLPDEGRLCHGDLHPGNVLVDGPGLVAIDWLDAAAGHPVLDVARSYVLLSAQSPGPTSQAARFARIYLRAYFAKAPAVRNLLRPCVAVVAAARLAEQIPEEQRWLAQTISQLAP
jgi:uncharacterized protein (TIGR02172 family)